MTKRRNKLGLHMAPSPLRLATVLLHAAASAAFSLPALPSRAAPRCAVACGFSVDTVDQKAIEDLGVFNWPGLERRVQTLAINLPELMRANLDLRAYHDESPVDLSALRAELRLSMRAGC